MFLHCNLFPFSPDLQAAELWKEINGVGDPELKRLAEHLPDTLLKAWAESTTKKYIATYGRWRSWAARNHTSSFPVSIPMFALYLQDVRDLSQDTQ